MFKKGIFILLLFIPYILPAQGVSFVAEGPPQVRVGQQFAITYKVNSSASNFIGPHIQNFDILSGPNVGTVRNSSNINGRVTSSIISSFTYFLVANKAGTYTIPQALINVGGKNYMSNKLTITVSKGSPNTGSAQSASAPQGATITDNVGKKIYIKAEADRTTVYQGEPIIITYNLYTPTPRMQLGSPSKIPSYPGFWAEDMLKNFTQYPQHIEGNYIIVTLRKVALYPQKSGVLNIDPLSQDIVYEVRVKDPNNSIPDDAFFSNDPFFKDIMDDITSTTRRVVKTIQSNKITINIKPLPENKPADFSGATGNFTIKAEIDKKQALTNDALTYKVTLSGTGNIILLEKPNITFPPDFEYFEPKIIDNIKSPSGSMGSRTFEYMLIPRSAGNFTINPVKYVFFDPQTQKYKEVFSEKIDLTLTKNPNDKGKSDIQERIKLQNTEIAPAVNPPLHLKPFGKFFFASLWYWIILIFLIISFILFVFFWKKNSKLHSDKKYMQRHKAGSVAEKRLQKSKSLMLTASDEDFYNEVAHALWGYIGDKFNIPTAQLSLNTAQYQLDMRSVNKEISNRFIEILNQCNIARYAPPGLADDKNKLYQDAVDIINSTEHQLSANTKL